MNQYRTVNVSAADYEPFDPGTFTDKELSYQEGTPGEVIWLRDRASGEQDMGPGKSLLKMALWRTTEATRLKFHVFADEIVHVLQGTVKIELSTGEVLDLKAGDITTFPAGVDTSWTISDDYVEFFALFGD